MIVVGYKSPHDGSLVLIKDDQLVFSIEGEKDSNFRYSGLNSVAMAVNALQTMEKR